MSNLKLPLSLTAVLVALAPDAGAAALQTPQPTQPSQPTDISPPGQPPSPGQQGQVMPPTQTTPSEPVVTDVEILAVLETITDTNIDQARDAQKSATDRRVKKFAESVVKRNQAAKRRQTTLRTRHNMQATGGQFSDNFKRESEQTFSDQRGLERSAEYDRTYIDNEIELLSRTIGHINNRLLPNVELPALRAELQTVLSQLESDLKSAQKLQSQLAEQKKTS